MLLNKPYGEQMYVVNSASVFPAGDMNESVAISLSVTIEIAAVWMADFYQQGASIFE
jgi:hypothetical protein